MELEFFESEVDLSTPVDVSKIATDAKDDEGGDKPIVDENPGEYTIIDVLDPEKKEITEPSDDGTGDEDETTKDEESKDTKDAPSDESADSSKFPYSTYAKALYEEGVLTDFDEKEFDELAEEVGEVEALIEMNRRTIVGEIEAYKNSLSPEQKDVLEAIEKGVPLDKYLQVKAKQQNYSSVKSEELADDDDLCKRLISDDLAARSYTPEEIKESLEDIESLGKLEDKAKTSLKRLQKTQAEELKRSKDDADKFNREAAERNKQALNKLKTDIDGVKEIMPGVNLNSKMRGKMYEALTTASAQTPDGQYLNAIYAKRAENPTEFDIKLAYLYNVGVFDGKWDKITSTATSGAVAALSDKLKPGAISSTGSPATPTNVPKSADILKSMGVFKKKN
jgi:hypothetical protein